MIRDSDEYHTGIDCPVWRRAFSRYTWPSTKARAAARRVAKPSAGRTTAPVKLRYNSAF